MNSTCCLSCSEREWPRERTVVPVSSRTRGVPCATQSIHLVEVDVRDGSERLVDDSPAPELRPGFRGGRGRERAGRLLRRRGRSLHLPGPALRATPHQLLKALAYLRPVVPRVTSRCRHDDNRRAQPGEAIPRKKKAKPNKGGQRRFLLDPRGVIRPARMGEVTRSGPRISPGMAATGRQTTRKPKLNSRGALSPRVCALELLPSPCDAPGAGRQAATRSNRVLERNNATAGPATDPRIKQARGDM